MINFQALIEQNREGKAVGLPCFCTTNETVLRALLQRCAEQDFPIVIEASSEQVNQDGGYTGINAADFAGWVRVLAAEYKVAGERLVLGGSKLGPKPWRALAANVAFDNTKTLVGDYAAAGFRKLHLDLPLSPNEATPPDLQTIATRTARLCEIANKHAPNPEELVFVLSCVNSNNEFSDNETSAASATTSAALDASIAAYQQAFESQGLAHIWAKVICLSAHTGAGFDHHQVSPMNLETAATLGTQISHHEGLCLATHSVDYQPAQSISNLVESRFLFVGVGPELTFRMRESIFALAAIEKQLADTDKVDLIEALEATMVRHPEQWQQHVSDESQPIKSLANYSFYDLVQYYWNYPEMRIQMHHFIARLDAVQLPEALVSQYFPLREFGSHRASASELVQQSIDNTVGRCFHACGYKM